MPSKSNKRRRLNPKPRQAPRQVLKKATRNWLDLPTDLTRNILQRVGVVDILENAQKVCRDWRKICKDPAMWRVVYMDSLSVYRPDFVWHDMCMQAVDRSQGQLLDLTIIGFCTSKLLRYVADRSSQLRRLEIVYYLTNCGGIKSDVFKKLSSLVELSLGKSIFNADNIEAIGRYCPLLKILKLNQEVFRLAIAHADAKSHSEIALAIGKHLPALTHLQLIQNSMQNVGLRAILDGCCHLESLDLRGCVYLDLDGDLAKRCSQQIKYLRLPHESLEGFDDPKDVDRTFLSLYIVGSAPCQAER